MSKITIRMENGVITSISGVPKGSEVEVRDYDCINTDDENFKKDSAGEEYDGYEPNIVEYT